MARSKFARWFLGDDRPQVEAAEPTAEPAPTESPYVGERDPAKLPRPEPEPTPPGWYPDEGSLRYFDGEDWTLLRAPLPPNPLTPRDISWAVFKGVLGALFLVWLGAQVAPDDIYLPVKFVVEELPEGF